MQCALQAMEFRTGPRVNLNKSLIMHQDPDILTFEPSKPAIFHSMPWLSPDAHGHASFLWKPGHRENGENLNTF